MSLPLKARGVRLEPEVEKAFAQSGLPFSGLANRLFKDFFNVKTEKYFKAQRLDSMIQKRLKQGGNE
jgi:hypothetical protein